MVPRIKNIETTISSALNKTKKEIIKNKEMLVLNHGTDMSGMRSMLNFASHHNAIIDHVNSKFLHQNIGVIQRTGYMATSLMEVKNRADLILIFGNDILHKTPRLLDKIFLPLNSLWTKNSKKEICRRSAYHQALWPVGCTNPELKNCPKNPAVSGTSYF